MDLPVGQGVCSGTSAGEWRHSSGGELGCSRNHRSSFSLELERFPGLPQEALAVRGGDRIQSGWMHFGAAVAGLLILAIILGDAFETIVLPRRVTRKLRFTRLFYRYTWLPWRKLVSKTRTRRRRETLLSYFGPLSLLFLLLSWALLLILAFALLQWAAGSPLHGDPGARFASDLYFSGTTFTTLGLGDLQPVSAWSRLLAVWEAGMGFGFLAIVIGYLPVIYQAFSRREGLISLLDARAGSPPSAGAMLQRAAASGATRELEVLLREYERWAAELLESHVSYPVLALFRSQHANASWLAALTAILDTCALLLAGVRGASVHQAQLTFAMARHVVVDLAQVLNTPPLPPSRDRLPDGAAAQLWRMVQASGSELQEAAVEERLTQLCRLYEPYVGALAEYLLLELPPWLTAEETPDNWQTSAWERAARRLPPPERTLFDEHL